jgi:CDP-glucose 4,6-dehydratase
MNIGIKIHFGKFGNNMHNQIEEKNVLVTGGAGLVGGHVVEKLLSLGARVFAIDIEVKPKSYFVSQKLQEKAKLTLQDVRDMAKLKELILTENISYIFHLAAQALVPLAYEDPALTLDTNIMGTVNVLEAARIISSVKAVIVASSDKAYGKDCVMAEENNPLAGDHPYDVSKSAADLICAAYFKTYGIPVTVSRFGNIFGPGDLNFNRIIPGIMKAAIKNEVLEIRSDGTFTRDYVYVKDVVDGYIQLAEQIDKAKGEAFNFSSGFNFSVLDLIKKTSEVIGKNVEYKIMNNQKNEIPEQSLNFEKAEKVLGWKSKYNFGLGILETFEWYKNFLNS